MTEVKRPWQRDLHGKTSLLSLATGGLPVTFFDRELSGRKGLKPELLDIYYERLARLPVIFGWIKDHLTWAECPGLDLSWQGILDALHLGTAAGPTLEKRLARALSPRDIVLTDKQLSTKIHITPYDELEDGMCAVRRSWAKRAMSAGGKHPHELDDPKFKCLSLTIITPTHIVDGVEEGGTIKCVGYLVDDLEYDIVCNQINLKPELYTTDGGLYIMFDLQFAYKDPKSNAEADVMIGYEMLYTKGQLKSLLLDRLYGCYDKIVAGTVYEDIEDWGTPELTRMTTFAKVNEDMASIPDMARDIHTRNLDIREFPGMISLIANGFSNQYRMLHNGQQWARYPVPCAISRPIISETAAELIGNPVVVAYGQLKAIRNGDVMVCNDDHWIDEVRENSGGGDFDDVWNLYYRMIEDEKSILAARNPMGWKEFTVFKYVEDDPFPTYKFRNDVVGSFPVMPGQVMTNLTEDLQAEPPRIRFTGLPEREPIDYPDDYGYENLFRLMGELVSDKNGNVGYIINVIILVAHTRPDLLANQIVSMEEIVDTFTKGGSMEHRRALTQWAKNLMDIIKDDHVIDAKLWKRRAGRTELGTSKLVHGFFSWFEETNTACRKSFMADAKAFAQAEAVKGGKVIAGMEELFCVARSDVVNTTLPVLVAARELTFTYRMLVNLQNKVAQSEYASGVTDRKSSYLSEKDWEILNAGFHTSVLEAAGDDPERQQYLMLACWFACMSLKTRRGYNDRMVWSSYRPSENEDSTYGIFLQGLVNWGLAEDLELKAASDSSFRPVNSRFVW